MSGGTLYTLPLAGGPDRKPTQIAHSDLRMFAPKFSPDGRFLSYIVIDKENRPEVFVRSLDPAATAGPWQISEGAASEAYWRRDGKELYYLSRDQSVMVADVSTAPTFSFSKPKVLFKQQAAVPDRLGNVSADGERFLALPPPRGPQLQQITIFDRHGEIIQKVGDPGLYQGPSFSPDGTHLLVTKNDRQTAQSDLWTIELASGKQTRLTNDTFPKVNPLWSPDGKYIYYSSFRNGDFPVYRKLSDGSGNEEIVFRYTPGAFVGLSDFSPDGKFLICDSGGIILAVPLTGDPASRKEIEFLREEFTDGIGRMSPDGKFMCLTSSAEGGADRRRSTSRHICGLALVAAIIANTVDRHSSKVCGSSIVNTANRPDEWTVQLTGMLGPSYLIRGASPPRTPPTGALDSGARSTEAFREVRRDHRVRPHSPACHVIP